MNALAEPPVGDNGYDASSTDPLRKLAEEAPNVTATIVDVLDDTCRRLSESGVDVEERMNGLAKLVEHVSRPETVDSICKIVDRLPQLETLTAAAAEAPNVIGTIADVVDEYSRKLKDEGIEMEHALAGGLHAALYLGARIREEELDVLGDLLRSDALNQRTIDFITDATSALVMCQDEKCDLPTPKRIGPFGLFLAMFDSNFQKAASFAVRFAQSFGRTLGK